MRYLQGGTGVKTVKIDQKDRRILALLASDARTPASAMARHAGLSRDAVLYRIERYSRQGLVQGYHAVVDIARFGYDAYHLFLQLTSPSAEVETKLVALFQSYGFVRAVIKFSGKFDFELALIAKSVQEFDAHLDTVLADCAPYVQQYEVMVISGNYVGNTFPRAFIAEENSPGQATAHDIPATIDEKDTAILHALANDGTASFPAIAAHVKLSHDVVRYRVMQMRKSGVISRFAPVINYAALGLSVYGVMVRLHGLTAEKNASLRELLQTDPHVLWAVKCVGRYNLLFYACVEKTEELHETLARLRSHFPDRVSDYEILIAYEEYKYTYFPDYAITQYKILNI